MVLVRGQEIKDWDQKHGVTPWRFCTRLKVKMPHGNQLLSSLSEIFFFKKKRKKERAVACIPWNFQSFTAQAAKSELWRPRWRLKSAGLLDLHIVLLRLNSERCSLIESNEQICRASRGWGIERSIGTATCSSRMKYHLLSWGDQSSHVLVCNKYQCLLRWPMSCCSFSEEMLQASCASANTEQRNRRRVLGSVDGWWED